MDILTGLSIKIMWYLEFQVQGLSLRLPSLSTKRGPPSLNRPNSEEPPGPPCNHNRIGADELPSCKIVQLITRTVTGNFDHLTMEGKNQKYMLLL